MSADDTPTARERLLAFADEPYRDFWSRIEPGDTIPAGDCPECGAFAFLDNAERS